jgi:hypothetical protein
MSSIDFKKLKSLLKLQEQIKPKTYLDELAEMGVLDIYVNDFLKDKYSNEPEFQERIYDSYYNYSNSINEDLEFYYLDKMCQSLSFFMEFTKECRIQKQ